MRLKGSKLEGPDVYNLEEDKRNEFQKKPIRQVDRLYTLREAAEIAGISYYSAFNYTREGHPGFEKLKGCMRFPDQHGGKRILWSHDTPRILKELRDKGLKNRGPRGKRWKWSKQKVHKEKVRRKRTKHDERAGKTRSKLMKEGIYRKGISAKRMKLLKEIDLVPPLNDKGKDDEN